MVVAAALTVVTATAAVIATAAGAMLATAAAAVIATATAAVIAAATAAALAAATAAALVTAAAAASTMSRVAVTLTRIMSFTLIKPRAVRSEIAVAALSLCPGDRGKRRRRSPGLSAAEAMGPRREVVLGAQSAYPVPGQHRSSVSVSFPRPVRNRRRR
jgi:hypothetical protein